MEGMVNVMADDKKKGAAADAAKENKRKALEMALQQIEKRLAPRPHCGDLRAGGIRQNHSGPSRCG